MKDVDAFRDAYERNGRNAQATADELGVPVTTLKSWPAYRQLRQEAREGHAPGHWDSGTAPGYHMGKVTVQRAGGVVERNWERQIPDGDAPEPQIPSWLKVGRITVQRGPEGVERAWESYNPDDRARETALKAAAEAMAADLPRLAPMPAPQAANDALCTVYTLTDAHVGMLAWREEGGADWDLSIAEQTLVGCFEAMVAAAPPSAVGIVNQLGDFLHFDGLSAITPTSGHLLDADGRFAKVVDVAIRILRRVIDCALQKHERVHVIMAEGNHDLASSVWLRKMFATLYENEPRITVDQSPLPYYVYQHGETMLAFHHGHLKKNNDLPLLLAAQFSKVWGATTKRYCHTGHRHHYDAKGHPGITVTQHATLAARDAYAARGGWFADREARAITYHSKNGQCGEIIVTPEMLAA